MKIELDGAKNIRDFSEYGFPGYIRSSHLHIKNTNPSFSYPIDTKTTPLTDEKVVCPKM